MSSTPQTPQAGCAPRFTFEARPHGEGGFAKVLKGRDSYLERDVAVKVLDQLATQFSEADQERFRREARTLARLSHPNIPAIYDVCFDPGKFQIIFQFIGGSTLRTLIDAEGPADIANVRTWFKQIASALEHAHGLDVVHRDIKPGNIVITPDRESAYLVDFGIALSAQDARRLTESGFWIGTPGYMSPEQQAGEDVDSRSDVYSLAVTLYEALAGHRIPQGQYQELSIINEAIPPQIDALVRDCLLEKERRLDSARSFASRLAGALRPTKPLSEVLYQGRLHEIAFALEDLSPDEFTGLPDGQRELILVKLADIVSSNDPQLRYAATQFLELLLTRGILLEKDSYREIVKPALAWGYDRRFDERQGHRKIRDALEAAAHQARADAHEVLREEVGVFVADAHLEDKEDWYLHSIRRLLQALLANPNCKSGAKELATIHREVNRIQRGRGSQLTSR